MKELARKGTNRRKLSKRGGKKTARSTGTGGRYGSINGEREDKKRK